MSSGRLGDVDQIRAEVLGEGDLGDRTGHGQDVVDGGDRAQAVDQTIGLVGMEDGQLALSAG